MKVRNGFVSNSSSSSFILIKGDINDVDISNKDIVGDTLYVGRMGKREFGWEHERSYNFHSKLNFAYLQLMIWKEGIDDGNFTPPCITLDHYNECEKMLKEVLFEVLGVTTIVNVITREFDITLESNYYGYIDHQSTFWEDGENMEMFENKDALKRFLFSSESFIETDNDNH